MDPKMIAFFVAIAALAFLYSFAGIIHEQSEAEALSIYQHDKAAGTIPAGVIECPGCNGRGRLTDLAKTCDTCEGLGGIHATLLEGDQ
jgi:hypothetical protein